MSKINCLWNTCFSWIIFTKRCMWGKIPIIDEGFGNEGEDETSKEETVVTKELEDCPGPHPGNADPCRSEN